MQKTDVPLPHCIYHITSKLRSFWFHTHRNFYPNETRDALKTGTVPVHVAMTARVIFTKNPTMCSAGIIIKSWFWFVSLTKLLFIFPFNVLLSYFLYSRLLFFLLLFLKKSFSSYSLLFFLFLQGEFLLLPIWNSLRTVWAEKFGLNFHATCVYSSIDTFLCAMHMTSGISSTFLSIQWF